jgi:hypothetical protein
LPASVFSAVCRATIGRCVTFGYCSFPRSSVGPLRRRDERPPVVDDLEDLVDVLRRNDPRHVARERVRRGAGEPLAGGVAGVLAAGELLDLLGDRPLPAGEDDVAGVRRERPVGDLAAAVDLDAVHPAGDMRTGELVRLRGALLALEVGGQLVDLDVELAGAGPVAVELAVLGFGQPLLAVAAFDGAEQVDVELRDGLALVDEPLKPCLQDFGHGCGALPFRV